MGLFNLHRIPTEALIDVARGDEFPQVQMSVNNLSNLSSPCFIKTVTSVDRAAAPGTLNVHTMLLWASCGGDDERTADCPAHVQAELDAFNADPRAGWLRLIVEVLEERRLLALQTIAGIREHVREIDDTLDAIADKG